MRIEEARFQQPRFAAVTDISEKGLENIIVTSMTGRPWPDAPLVGEGTGWLHGVTPDYAREWCVDLAHLTVFLSATQPKMIGALDLARDSPTRRQFLSRLLNEVGKRGVVDVLRNGVKHGAHEVTLFYATPSAENEKATALNAENRFSVTRQLRYSRDETMRALDLGLFINGLPLRPSSSRIVSPNKPSPTPSSNTSATAIRVSRSSRLGAALCILPLMIPKCECAQSWQEKALGSYPLIRAGTMVREIRPIHMA